MADLNNLDDWELIGEWDGQSPGDVIKEIKLEAKQKIAEMDKTINKMDKVYRFCKDWQRKMLFRLCPECREKCLIKNTVNCKSKCPPTSDTQHLEKEKKTSLVSHIKNSGIRAGPNKQHVQNLVTSNVVEDTSKINPYECLLQTKEAAFENYYQSTDAQIEEMKRKNSELQAQLESANRDRDQALVATAQRVKENENITAEMEILSEKMKNDRQEFTQKISDMSKQIRRQEKQITSLENELGTKDENLRTAQKKLAEAVHSPRKDVVLGIRNKHSGMGSSMVDMVIRELTGQLNKTLGTENLNLIVKQCQTMDDIPRGMMAVLCLNMSRVGTNIKDALTGIKVNRDVFVIVFHHTSKENLSSLTPTSHRITGSELRQLGAIIDMVFSSDGGIYDCDVNDKAVANIATLISRYS